MLATGIFVATLVLVIWQPKGLGIGWSALLGAALALATGVVALADVVVVWHIVWDATFTFVALIVMSLILDRAGCFTWAALHIARWGGGRGAMLFVLVVLLGAVISAFFANDGAALLLTPIVLAILVRLGFPAAAALAFVIATGFIADTASLPLVSSNLVNIVTANYFDVRFGRYALVMVPVDVVSIGATLLVLWLAFRRVIPARYAVDTLEVPDAAIVDRLVFRAAGPILCLWIVACFVLTQWRVPVSFVTGGCALLLMAVAGRWWQRGRGAVVSLGSVLRDAPWQIVLFSLGMYLVVYGLGQAGLTKLVAGWLDALAAHGTLAATVGTGFLTAVMASIMNNMPSTLVSALAVGQADVSALTHELMLYAGVIGNDLGPKLTPIGSLATLLWLHVLAGKGQRIGWGQYMRIGLLLAPPVLLVTLVALWAWLSLVGAA